MVTTRERRKLKELASDYRKRGYEVFVEGTLPDDVSQVVGSWRPDLVARNENETVVIEVKTKVTVKSEGAQLRGLANRISSSPGWRFEVVYSNPRAQSSQPPEAPAEWPQRGDERTWWERIEIATKLATEPDQGPAILVLWSGAEPLLRAAMKEAGFTTPREDSARSLVKRLYSYGLANRKELSALEELIDARNQAAHGTIPRPPHRGSFEEWRDLVKAVATRGPA